MTDISVPPAPTQRSGPLSGIRIIDMTSVLMGPYATQILADYGADVIKIESNEGDLIRLAGAMRTPKMGSLFLHANRNKRSVVLDAKSPAGREAMLTMCRSADVFVSNIRPPALERLGLGYPDVATVNPAIIYASLVGYGQDGPYAQRPAYDDLIQGISALPSLIASRSGEPQYTPLTLADKVSGLAGVNAILAALVHKVRTGVGQSIEVPMFEVMSQFVLGDHLGGLSFDPPHGPVGYNRLLSPDRRPYRTADGYICALVYTDRHWRNFFQIMEQPETFAAEPLFHDHAVRTRNYDEVYRRFSEMMATKTTIAWQALFEEYDIPWSPAHSVEDLLKDPHLEAVDFFQMSEHPTEGTLRLMRQPVRFSATPASIYRHPPTLGEHTREVLAEFGLDQAACVGTGAGND